MNAPEVSREPSLFDRAVDAVEEGDSASSPQIADAHRAAVAESSAPSSGATSPDGGAEPSEVRASEASPEVDSDAATAAAATPAPSDRKRISEQLDALKRKEFELRRALVAADHPDLADAIRVIEGRAFNVSRAEAKLAQGFSKTEARRREVLEKKLASLRAKRAELDAQIGTLESELGGLGADRLATFQTERQQALQELLIALATHEAALKAAGVAPAQLVPEIEGWLPELESLASDLSAARA